MGQNIICGIGNALGTSDTLHDLHRARLVMIAVGPVVFIVTLTMLAANLKVRWPCVHQSDKPGRMLCGQIMVVLSVVVGLMIGSFAIWRDFEVELLSFEAWGGMLIYSPKHLDFGMDYDNIQEWLPSLVLLVWSLPLAILIQRKGGLRWYRNRYYGDTCSSSFSSFFVIFLLVNFFLSFFLFLH